MSDLITAEEAQKRLEGLEIDLSGVNAGAPFLEALRDYARTVIALHAQLADAKAAQAMVVERAAEICWNKQVSHHMKDGYILEDFWHEHGGTHPGMAYAPAIRALADTDGLAMVQELRADVTGWEDNANAVLSRLIHAEADRDRLAAEKAELEARVEKLVGALNYYADPRAYCSDCTNALDKGARARAALSNLTPTPSSDPRENGHTPHEFYGSARTGCRECGHGQDHPIHTNRAAGPDTPTPSDTGGPVWHERLGWDGNKEGEG